MPETYRVCTEYEVIAESVRVATAQKHVEMGPDGRARRIAQATHIVKEHGETPSPIRDAYEWLEWADGRWTVTLLRKMGSVVTKGGDVQQRTRSASEVLREVNREMGAT